MCIRDRVSAALSRSRSTSRFTPESQGDRASYSVVRLRMSGWEDDRCCGCDGMQAAVWIRPVGRASDLYRIAKAHVVSARARGCQDRRYTRRAFPGWTMRSAGSTLLARTGSKMKQLSGLDNVFLQLERGNQHMHVAGLAIYDPSTAPEGRVRFRDVLRFFEARLGLSLIHISEPTRLL